MGGDRSPAWSRCSDPGWGDPASAQPTLPQPSTRWSHPNLSAAAAVTPCNEGQGRPRTPPRAPTTPHLLGHRAVHVLGDAAGHQVHRDGADKVPAQRRVVLQAVARAVLCGKREGGKGVVSTGTGSCSSCSAAPIPLAQEGFAVSSPRRAGLQLTSQQWPGPCQFQFPFCQFSWLDLITNSCCL